MEQVPWLTAREERVWRLFAAVLVVLPDEVDAQLQREAGLSQFGYGVLSALSEAPGRAMRMTDLARLANGSRSRLSHLMGSLERRGWVRRERAAEDGRGSVAKLTDAGYAKVAAIAPGHVRAVRSAVFDKLDAQQLDELEGICRELLSAKGRLELRRIPDSGEQTAPESHHFDDSHACHQYGDTGTSADPAPMRHSAAAEGDAAHRLAQRHSKRSSAHAGADTLKCLLAAVHRDRADAASPDRKDPVTGEDLMDGLSLIAEARSDVDFAELELIDHARASGQTWAQIATALGMPDRRQAQTRFRRLRERWPGYEPVSTAAQ